MRTFSSAAFPFGPRTIHPYIFFDIRFSWSTTSHHIHGLFSRRIYVHDYDEHEEAQKKYNARGGPCSARVGVIILALDKHGSN